MLSAWEKSKVAFLDEMRCCEQLGLTLLNFHPGSHLKKCSEEECLTQIAESLNWAFSQTKNVKAVIEKYGGTRHKSRVQIRAFEVHYRFG